MSGKRSENGRHTMDPARKLSLPSSPSSADKARLFAAAVSAAKGGHLLVALRGHPDPDGIACALAQAHIAARLGVEHTTIGYCHDLSHRENRALVKLLGLELKKIRSVNDAGKVDYLALVDSLDLDPDLADAEGLEILTIVDHHKALTPPKARFVDLRLDA